MDQKEFKLFFKNKSPLLYTYLLTNVINSNVANDLITNIFARFYRTRLNIPQTISREKWLLIITKKFMIEYFEWRTTEDGQQMTELGITSYDCSHLAEQHKGQLREWINSLNEFEQSAVNDNIISELPPPEVRFSLKDIIKNKIKETEESARQETSTMDYFKNKIKKIKEDSANGNKSSKK